MTKVAGLVAISIVGLITVSTKAAKTFVFEKETIVRCQEKALDIAEKTARISFEQKSKAERPVIHFLNETEKALTYEVHKLQASMIDGDYCDYHVQMRKNALGECWLEKLEQTKCYN